MLFKVSNTTEFHWTNVTCQPGTFIVWLQQMCLKLVRPSKTFWTVSTWVRLCTSVNTDMQLQMLVHLKQLPAVRTFMWSSVAVYLTFMHLQVVGPGETFVTQWTLVPFISLVDSHMTMQIFTSTKCLATHATFVWFLSTVNSTVNSKVFSCCKSFATNTAFKRLLSWMNSSVYC